MASPKPTIRRQALSSPHVEQLFQALNAELDEIYPEDGANHFRLDEREVSGENGAILVAYINEQPVACAAIRRLDSNIAELKRLFVTASARGQGLARELMMSLEREALQMGVRRLVLETGDRQPGALALAEQFGFARIPPFGEYENSPLSVCMGKDL